VYPDDVWYAGLDDHDADALVDHLHAGNVLTAKRVEPPG
jgi:(2Fe-2S) ferredoxin